LIAIQYSHHDRFAQRSRLRTDKQHHRSGVGRRVRKFYEQIAIPAGSFARAVVFAMSQPEDVDVNEILFRPTRREL
jgi:NADP-dependent 3-hydroxy acid dehydrogenase YdfG